MSKKILSEDSRERLVAACEKTKDIKSVAVMFGVAESTVYRLVTQKRKTGSLALQTHKRGVKSKLTDVMLEQIKQKIREMVQTKLKVLEQKRIEANNRRFNLFNKKEIEKATKHLNNEMDEAAEEFYQTKKEKDDGLSL